MEKITIPNFFILFMSLSLWSMAFHASTEGMAPRLLVTSDWVDRGLDSDRALVREGLAGEPLLEEGMPIMATAAGHWF